MFDHLLECSLRFHINRKTGEILRAQKRGVMSIVTILSSVLFQIAPTLVDIGIAVGFFTLAFDRLFGIIVFVTMSLYVVSTIVLTEWRTAYRRRANLLENLMEAKAVDSLLNYETVKYYAAERFESEQYAQAVDDYQEADKKSNGTTYILTLVQNVIIQAGLLVGGLLCAYQVTQGEKTVGDFVLYLAYILQLYQPLNNFGSYYKSIQKNLVDMEKMIDLMHEPIEVNDPPDPKPLVVQKGEVEFRNVTFAYDERIPILKNVSFKVPSGRTVAIVGPSGGGKSTILRLLLRFYDIQEGSILIDGVDVRDVKQFDLRSQIGVVPQVDANDEQIAAAAVAAKIHEKILGFPDGYETKVGERGLRLSGGEKQRVAIARTVLKNPQIVLLDEATSALDTSTERHIQKSLQQMTVNRTTLIIAHRLSTIVHADLILVVKAGEIVERGSHDELMQIDNGVYFKLWNKQLKDRLKIKSKIKRLGRTTSVRSRKNSRRYKAPAHDPMSANIEDIPPQPNVGGYVPPPLPVAPSGRYVPPRTRTGSGERNVPQMTTYTRGVTEMNAPPQTYTYNNVVDRSSSRGSVRPQTAYIHNNEVNRPIVRSGNVRPYTMHESTRESGTPPITTSTSNEVNESDLEASGGEAPSRNSQQRRYNPLDLLR
ncbi:5048_t:CDS:10 [Paraglomus occultum]|uniref:5048_t:CDS:1 n=1 Tax=Paraglomus occultum TaxID=144539 RepID=A0A9N8ZPX6_9GLOM|nr:5048_t:CDS:10 [Paraglomus occultum]